MWNHENNRVFGDRLINQEDHEWLENLKEVLLKAGISDKPVVFLFNDTQIVFESMLEDVNNVLNTGDVPNLYGPEEFDTIYTTCKPDCVKKRVPPTKINMFAAYIARAQARARSSSASTPRTACCS